LLAVALAAGACRKPKEQPKESAPAPVAPPPASQGSDAAAPAAAPHAVTSEFFVFADVATFPDVRIALERRGDEVTVAVETRIGLQILRGVVKGTRLTATEPTVATRARAASFEGELTATRLTGQFKDPNAKQAVKFAGDALAAFKDAEYKETYVGALGPKLQIRAMLARDKEKLTGVYRYARSGEDLHVTGVVRADGQFNLHETTAAGTMTGSFEGIFVRRDEVLARWWSADGTRSFLVVLEHGVAYLDSVDGGDRPQTSGDVVALEGGGRIIPKSARQSSCDFSAVYPQVVALKSKATEDALNAQLRGIVPGSDEEGEGVECGSDEGPGGGGPGSHTGYRVDTQRGRYLGLAIVESGYKAVHRYFRSTSCYVADLETGSVDEVSSLLTPQGRDKLAKMVSERDGHPEDSDADPPKSALCLDRNGLRVDFDELEATRLWAPGPVNFTRDEVRGLFQPNELTKGLFGK
jgi:hypothetical protein